MRKYFNYHRHTYSSNVTTIDCTVSNEDYAKRAMELGHEWISSCEHGGTINWVDAYMIAQKNKLKYVHVGEYYFVPCRHLEEEKVVECSDSYFMGFNEMGMTRVIQAKDKSNYHLILVAKTKKAFEELNYIMSEANISGYYYKPRIDLELLRGLPKGEVYCTTACLGGFLRDYPENKWLLEELIDIFGENFYLEVQPHPSNKQIEYNEMIKEIAKEYGLKIIGACDSHMIDEKGKIDRNYLLHSKKIMYEDEEGWYLDYPDYDTLFQRFMEQGIWNENEVHELLDNTLHLTQVEQIYIDPKMKVPTIFPDKDREWKLGYLKKLIFEKWEKYKGKVPKARWKKYKKEILLEYSIIERTKMEDYFISNYHIINRGIELGGLLTRSSRGSGASFFINMLLGFTTIDRLKSKLPMLPQRFMSISRIIEENSSPDIDFNIYNREYFLQAQDELFGETANYFMVAYGTLGVKSAFKMLCRAKDIDIETADEISKLIASWENDKKHNEDADIMDYIKDPYHIQLIKESEKYNGIIDSMSSHPCATILSNTDIRRAFGVMKSPNGVLVANITGKQSEKMGYLKNDFLIVDVVDLNDKLYKRVGMEYIGAEDLYEEIEKYDGIWDLFANGYTLCLNQMESSGTTQKMMRYKPRGLYELSNSVGAIRPGFASNYQMYEKRENFQYGIPFIDKILQGEFIEGSYLLYQEQQMKLLELIGIEPDRIVATIKAISKKNIDVIESIGADFNTKMFNMAIENGETDEDKVRDVISRLWRVFVDSAKYMFNTPHAQATATDCLHSALIKYLYPIEFYEVVLEKYSSAKDTQKVALLKNEAYRYKGITVTPMRYGQNNTKFTANKDTNEIYQSMLSVKAINKNTADVLYDLGLNYKPENFFDLYLKMKEIGLSKTHISNLAKIGYFNDIEPIKRKCLWLSENFDKYNKKQLKKDKIDELWKDFKPPVSIIDFYNDLKSIAIKETPKQLAFNEGDLIKYFYSIINIQDDDKLEEMYWECELLGTTIDDVDETFMLGRIGKWNPSTNKIVFKHIKTNNEQWIKVNCNTHFKEKDYIFIDKVSSKVYRGREYFTAESVINLSEKYKKVVDKK